MGAAMDIIQKRCSWRNYEPGQLSQELTEKIVKILGRKVEKPFKETTRFVLIRKDGDKRHSEKIGTYGTITGAQYYIVGAVEKGPTAEESYGYALEQIILDVTALGLGTCWLGGAFSKSSFARRIDAKPDERVPAVTPVGLPAGRRGLVDRLLRMSVNSKHRKAWDALFFDGSSGTPLTEEAAGKYNLVLEGVRLGPSASNRQPWRIIRENNRFHLYLRNDHLYSRLAKTVLNAPDIQRLDMGIAVCHFDYVCQSLGLQGKWQDHHPSVQVPAGWTYTLSWAGDE